MTWKENRNQIASQIPLTDFLYSTTFENYCKDPFDEENKQQFFQELKSPIMVNNRTKWEGDESVKMKPPFPVSYKSMSIDAGLGPKQRASAEMVNKWCLLPWIFHVLWAHKTNKSLMDTAKDPVITSIILYTMRHHVHNFGNINLS